MTPSTAIEALVAQANAEEGSPGFHVTARFQDGSVIDAPILDHGPNWMRVAEIVEDGFFVDLTGAALSINWAPGPSYVSGPLFAGVVPMQPAVPAPNF